MVDFKRLAASAKAKGVEIALDLAFQCSPDHPWVREHPSWFKHLPDGTIQTAENPPKRYEDVYPLDFATADWRNLWEALRQVTEFWIAHGVRIFRVDNPHTKPLRFWEWLIATVRADHPEVIMLAEAFTRPRIMEYLAKLGFSQSYTYFTWRNTASELRDYLTEVTQSEMADYFRPNLWPNTPDILHEFLQRGGRAAFSIRLVLAATLAASYGIYGPPFELAVNKARTVGSEEYLHSEKFEGHHWDLDDPTSLAGLITTVNTLRPRPSRAATRTGRFASTASNNDRVLVYSKTAGRPAARRGALRHDPHGRESRPDLCTARNHAAPRPRRPRHRRRTAVSRARPTHRHQVRLERIDNYVRLDPAVQPAHIFSIEQTREHDTVSTSPALASDPRRQAMRHASCRLELRLPCSWPR